MSASISTSAYRKLRLVLIILLTLATLGPGSMVGPAHASDFSFNPAINLSNDPFVSEIPTITATGSGVYAVWQNSTATRTDILFRASNDNGSSFGPILDLSKSLANGDSGNQEIAATGSYVYVVWQDNTTSDIWFTSSNNLGQSFASPVNLSADSRASTFPYVAAAGNSVYVTWQNDVAGGGTDIFFRASTNNGIGFTIISNLSNDKKSIVTLDPKHCYPIAAQGNNVYVAWIDNSLGAHDLFLKTSANSGASFGFAQNLSNNPTSPVTNVLNQRLATAGNDVYAVWTRDLQTGPDDTMIVASSNSGSSFAAPIQLTSNGNSINPQVAAAGTSVYAVWEDHSIAALSTVSLVSSSNNGATFGSTVSLSSGTGLSTEPQVTAIGTNVYAAWQDRNANNNVYLKSSNDNAASFGSAVNISQDTNSQPALTPTLAANGNNVYIAWQDDSGQTNPDILFRTNTSKVNFSLNALFAGWNTTNPGSVNPCSPSGALNCNPTLTRFKGRPFTIQIVWKDSVQHDIALYTNGTLPGSVLPTDICSPTNTAGCLAKTSLVTSSSTTALLTFTPTVPAQNFTGLGGYEYYCQYHPASMHGHIKIYKSPDIDGNGVVNILDIATIAFAFGSAAGPPPSSTWNIAADLDNNGKVNILDVAFAAFYFGRSP